MVCLGRIEKKQSYLGALPKQGISRLPFGLLNQDATGTETNNPGKPNSSAPGNASAEAAGGDSLLVMC